MMFLKQNGDAAAAVVAELTQTSATSKEQACSNLTNLTQTDMATLSQQLDGECKLNTYF